MIVVASRNDGATLSAQDVDALERLLPVLGTHADADPTGPLVSEDEKAAVLVTPIAVGQTSTDTAAVISALRADVDEHAPDGMNLLVTGARRSAPISPPPSKGPTSPCCS